MGCSASNTSAPAPEVKQSNGTLLSNQCTTLLSGAGPVKAKATRRKSEIPGELAEAPVFEAANPAARIGGRARADDTELQLNAQSRSQHKSITMSRSVQQQRDRIAVECPVTTMPTVVDAPSTMVNCEVGASADAEVLSEAVPATVVKESEEPSLTGESSMENRYKCIVQL